MLSLGVNVGIAGFGAWGSNHARNFHALGALAAICDTDPAARSRAGAQYPNCAIYAGIDELLADPAVDAVAITTSSVSHGALARKALAAGKPVFVEKPLCPDLDEAETVVAEAAQRGLLLMVGHLLLYHPAFQRLADLVHDGELGTLRYVYSQRLSLGRIRRDENALWSFAPHDTSMILNLSGRLPETVITTGGRYLSQEVADTTLTHLDFGDGLMGHIFVSWLHPFKDQRLVVVGEKAMAVFDDVLPHEQKLLLYRHRMAWDGDIPIMSKADAEQVRFDHSEPLKLECEIFVRAVAGELAPLSDGGEALRVMRVLDACQRSLMDGTPVRLADAPKPR
jgi:UDP-2-acetamido-3-amino-2,3-dideoxy-glucuronate N-acetyltransferase